MRGFSLVHCIWIAFAVCLSSNAEFNKAPPDDITAAAGQTVLLHWEFQQNSAETVTIELTKHCLGDFESMECINATDKGVQCNNGTGYVNVMLVQVNKGHQGRYSLAITNGFKGLKSFNIHVIDFNTTLVDAKEEVIYAFPQSNIMDEYSMMNLPEVNLNSSTEYTLLLTLGDSASTNVTCFIDVDNQHDYFVYRSNQSEIRYYFYASPYLVNQRVYLECEIRQTIQPFVLRHRVNAKHPEMPENTPLDLDGVVESIRTNFSVVYGLLGVAIILSAVYTISVYLFCRKYVISACKLCSCCNTGRDSNQQLPLVPQTDIKAVVGELKQHIDQAVMRRPRQRTLSDRSETG